MSSVWKFIERYSFGNQLLFTPHASSYDATTFSHPTVRLAYFPTLTPITDDAELRGGTESQQTGLMHCRDADNCTRLPFQLCFFRPSASKVASKLLVIHFHGTGGDAWKSGKLWFHLADSLPQDKDVSVLSVEYPGYGALPSRPSEEQCKETAVSVLRYVLGVWKLDPQQIIISGRSMGSGVASYVASQLTWDTVVGKGNHQQSSQQICFGGLVLISPFTSIHGPVGNFVGGSILQQLIRDRFPNVDYVAALPSHTRLLVFHGKKDTLIPFQQAESLIASAVQCRNKTLVLDDEGDHHHIPDVNRALTEFVNEMHARVETKSFECVHRSLVDDREISQSAAMQRLSRVAEAEQARLDKIRWSVMVATILSQYRLPIPTSVSATSALTVLWAALLMVVGLGFERKSLDAKKREVGGKVLGLSTKPRAAILNIVCRILLPLLLLRHEALVTAAVGSVATHLLLA